MTSNQRHRLLSIAAIGVVALLIYGSWPRALATMAGAATIAAALEVRDRRRAARLQVVEAHAYCTTCGAELTPKEVRARTHTH